MAYNEGHNLFSLHGALPSGEVWSCGLRATSAATTQSSLDIMCTGMALKFKAFIVSLSQTTNYSWATGVTFDGVTGRVISTAGVTTIQSEVSPTGGYTASSRALTLPPQCATVVTLLTARPGRTGKGRIYLPLLSPVLSSNGRIPAGTVGLVASAFKTFIDDTHVYWNAGVPTIASRIAVFSQVGAGAASPMTALRVGDIVDTQRRRRDSIAEAYTSASIA